VNLARLEDKIEIKGYSQPDLSRTPLSIFASTSSCAPRVFRRASQGPQGRVVPFGGARRGPDRRSCTAVSSADRAESLGL
jgi:hypothetical protein